MKNQENNWKIAFWALLALVSIFLVFNVLKPGTYEQTSQEWSNYKDLLNADLEKINSIGKNECNNPKTYQEVSDCIGSLSPRLQAYKLHLEQARSFLNTNGEAFSNRLELQADVDDQLVWVVGVENKLDSAIKEYNSNIQSQQDQQEALLNLLGILAGGI